MFSPSGPSSRDLALVTLRGSDAFVVQDITDISHPFTVSTLGNQVYDNVLEVPQFVSAAEISTFIPSTGLVRMPLSTSPKTVATACGSERFAWRPDGTAAAYVAGTQDPRVEALHIVSNGRDNIVDSIRNDFPGGGCENRSSCNGWAFGVLYSPNGAYISLVEAPGTGIHVWTSSGKLVTSTVSGTLPVWSGDALYWRDVNGVAMWRNRVVSVVLPGVSWNGPHASASGGSIVYETRDAGSDTAHVRLLDTRTGTTREIAQSRGYPAFLTSRYIWYRGERPCAASEPCMDPTTPTGNTYIYDLQTGTESQSIITDLWDVWPHPA
jgi:hypothetical protein